MKTIRFESMFAIGDTVWVGSQILVKEPCENCNGNHTDEKKFVCSVCNGFGFSRKLKNEAVEGSIVGINIHRSWNETTQRSKMMPSSYKVMFEKRDLTVFEEVDSSAVFPTREEALK